MTIAFVAFVYGDRYQEFLPMYAESLFRVYPESPLLLYPDRHLRPEITRLLRDVETRHASRIELRDGRSFGLPAEGYGKLSPQIRRSFRWLLWDPMFEEFDHIYVGDIDMLMVPERADLEDTHSRHAKMLSLPYSNVVRLSSSDGKPSLRLAASMAAQGDIAGVKAAVSRGEARVLRRLTGLHFLNVADYYRSVGPVLSHFRELLSSNSRNLNDEEILYDLVRTSGLPLPPVSPCGPDLDPMHDTCISFRPHHGIHMGLFRSQTPMLSHAQTLQSYVYRDYYAYYQEMRAEECFRSLVTDSGPYVGGLFASLNNFLEHELDAE